MDLIDIAKAFKFKGLLRAGGRAPKYTPRVTTMADLPPLPPRAPDKFYSSNTMRNMRYDQEAAKRTVPARPATDVYREEARRTASVRNEKRRLGNLSNFGQ